MWIETEFFSLANLYEGEPFENDMICSQYSLPVVMTCNAVLQQRPDFNPGKDTARIELQLTLFDSPVPRGMVTSEALSWRKRRNIKIKVFSYLFEGLLSTHFGVDAQCLNQTLTYRSMPSSFFTPIICILIKFFFFN